ncbi:MAG: indolepyruvate oxidoreductase subunit beta [Chloroflexi bacterium]|nr:indolepyruvate oxidoreductase subunit beta [Chloroflexota bacterium]
MKKLDILIAGAGGQGVVLSSDLVAEVALASGYDAKKTDIHGMAQRGGSVISHVRTGPRVWSPLSREGDVDILLAYEKLEAGRWSYFLRPGGVAIVNNYALPPLSVNLGVEKYPGDDEIASVLKQSTDEVYLVAGTSLAAKLGDMRTVNVLMLGCASAFMPFKLSVWNDVLSNRLPAKIRQINLAAFERGRKEIRGAHI